VIGLGYVGCVTAACLSDLGHKVTGVDRDAHKVQDVLDGKAPFYEPGLEELIKRGVAADTLSASVDLAQAIADADVALICVGTPSEKNGNLGVDQLRRVCTEIAQYSAGRSKPLIVAVRSTVFPGTCEEVVIPLLGNAGNLAVVSNPEFLREGSAVKDFIDPALLVIGGNDSEAVQNVAALYEKLKVQPSLVSLRTAEMIKYACNSFHAIKVAFANEIGAICDRMDIPAGEVMDTFCQDTRLNISRAYLKPGFAFGGSCLPKDLRALNYRANRLDVKVPLLESVLSSNDQHLTRGITAALEIPVERIGVYGLAFKENTDDLRESPVVSLLEAMIGKGRNVRVYDPHIDVEAIYGSNKRFILDAVPHISRLMVSDLRHFLGDSQYLIIAQKPSESIGEAILASGLPMIDLVGVFRHNGQRHMQLQAQ
jgi:GDP-mannose 6-dehydrogenase